MTLSVTYIHQNSYHMLRSRNLNRAAARNVYPAYGSGVRPLGNIGNLFDFESSGASRSDGSSPTLEADLPIG